MATRKAETERKILAEQFLDAIHLTDAEMAKINGGGFGRYDFFRRNEDINLINNINLIAANNGWGPWF